MMDLILKLMDFKPSPGLSILLASVIVPLLMYCKGIPGWIYNRICLYLTICLTVDETDNMAGTNTFHSLNSWLCKNRIPWLTRVFEVDGKRNIVAGIGFNVFIFKGKLFWCQMGRKDPATSFSKIKSIGTYNVYTFKWNKGLLSEFISASCKPLTTEFTGYLYRMSNADVNYITRYPSYMKNQKQLIANDTYQSICNIFNKFTDEPDWYYQHDKPHKETILLYGPPGTGKTNLIRHLAAKYNMDLISISPEDVTLDTFTRRSWDARELDGFTVYLVEDIDSNKALLKGYQTQNSSIVINTEADAASAVKGTLSEMLNALDGAVPLDRCIVILTTNHVDKLEKAIYRAGRVDHHVHMDYIKFEDAIAYLKWDASDTRYKVLKQYPEKLHAATVSQLPFAKSPEEVLTVIKGGEISTTIGSLP